MNAATFAVCSPGCVVMDTFRSAIVRLGTDRGPGYSDGRYRHQHGDHPNTTFQPPWAGEASQAIREGVQETTLNGRTRKISQAQVQKEGLGDRLDDLMQAMLWVKQELILLRQHDILLKRQFFNIQDTIHSLQRPKPEEQSSSQHKSKHHVHFHDMDNYLLDNFVVRPSSSVTLLNDVDEGEEEDDTFRPRTCSMRTSRDLAALARRRGSKELV